MASENTTPIKQTNHPPDDSDHEDSFDPKDEINPFDWQDLEARYLSAMAECKAKEDVHLEEFESLSQYFGFWAETISDHEQKRSHQRPRALWLKDRKPSLKKEERIVRSNLWNRLLNTSLMNLNIDIKVVEAFQNALNMLNNLSAPQHQHHA
ncbi:hypothetical protein D6D13_00800 [Aureobasidium pullulans]|uniref:Uncharacterized protein n=2 Tax=Aureobasidium pullulans TaxID=5580 RepID=A0A4S9Q4R2_AURPU|nr:hypothetical protein D6D13_00800 [Aureobasidium pullulans]THX84244.1 hypothetical protein D6D04_02554 [Aureobasidium pullulans]THY77485.1 hypothetical protein D6C94_02063 [Aureobasidium pullulans]